MRIMMPYDSFGKNEFLKSGLFFRSKPLKSQTKE